MLDEQKELKEKAKNEEKAKMGGKKEGENSVNFKVVNPELLEHGEEQYRS